MRYFIDENQQYKDDLLVHLRAHNFQFVEKKENELRYIYIHNGNELIGAVAISFHWNWVGFSNLFYTSIDILKALMMKTVSLYKSKAAGFKMFCTVEKTISDLQKAGFKEVGRISHPNSVQDRVYLDLIDYDISPSQVYEIEVLDKEDDTHKVFLEQYEEYYDKKHDIEEIEDVLYVCMDNDIFCGGVYIEVYKYHTHTHLLAVNKNYMGRQIGTKLMNFVEEYSRKLGHKLLTVGTTNFQAKPFYEKLGYTVVYTRKEHPKGYEAYTLIKELEE